MEKGDNREAKSLSKEEGNNLSPRGLKRDFGTLNDRMKTFDEIDKGSNFDVQSQPGQARQCTGTRGRSLLSATPSKVEKAP